MISPHRAEHRLRAELLDLAARLAVEAGRAAARGRRAGVRDVGTKSSATDMVTEFDRAAEHQIITGIEQHRPSDAIVGEEGTAISGTSGVEWVIDPIDGTTNFLYGLPGWAVSIAARLDGTVVAGAVYVPALDELFTAVRGGGAHLDGRPIRAGRQGVLADALVATGFSYLPARREAQAAVVSRVIGRIRDLRRSGAAAVDLCHVAAGRVDAYYERWLAEWDWAAGALIAEEAGARTGFVPDGDDQILVAAAADLFESFVDLLGTAIADEGSTDPDPPRRVSHRTPP